MKKLITPILVLAVFACANEPEVAETEPVVTETNTTVLQTDPADADTAANDWWIYTDWDVDANQELTQTEFDQRWETGFAEWDVDGDGALGPDESADTLWDWFDGNDDNIIDENEWTAGVNRWDFEGVEWGERTAWDVDANNELTENEWREGWNANVWNNWNGVDDGAIGRDEWRDTFWDFFDGNNDDIVDAGEWGYQG
ncbi:MAG: hypothetical protein KY432_02955 [Acidobacteria bacterium]|nr:hypothetical protein [Acidobacteriota bacterium]